MFYLYSDEAGTSENEPVTVVVSVAIHADRHWRAAADRLREVLDDGVPRPLREGFIFHAKNVWSGYRDYDQVWSREHRAELIGAVASIPRFLEAAICIGKVRRDSSVPPDFAGRPEDFHHAIAFWFCMLRANKYVRDWAEPGEIATVVAEDVPKKRRFLKRVLKLPPPTFPLIDGAVMLTADDKKAGKILQTNSGEIDRIIDTVHFVEKDEAPLLQLADACAFSFRRYFAGQDYGSELVRAMLGEDLSWEEWQGPASQVTFSFNPAHAYPVA